MGRGGSSATGGPLANDVVPGPRRRCQDDEGAGPERIEGQTEWLWLDAAQICALCTGGDPRAGSGRRRKSGALTASRLTDIWKVGRSGQQSSFHLASTPAPPTAGSSFSPQDERSMR
ncbi:hypothetical protein VTI28DRAFT_1905 [Corynascus sepedonium]